MKNTNVYVLSYRVFDDNLPAGILTFTNKQEAIEQARYYRDELHCVQVGLRHDKKFHHGWNDIMGFIEF